MRDLQEGRPAFDLDGKPYGFVRDSAAAHKSRVLVPEGGAYRSSARGVDAAVHLVRVPQLAGQEVAPSGGGEVRRQPKGLKMRFHPAGFGEGEGGVIGSEDEAEEEAPKVFKKHKALEEGEGEKEGEKERKKRKSGEKEERKLKKRKERA